jgi:hypothetical protein
MHGSIVGRKQRSAFWRHRRREGVQRQRFPLLRLVLAFGALAAVLTALSGKNFPLIERTDVEVIFIANITSSESGAAFRELVDGVAALPQVDSVSVIVDKEAGDRWPDADGQKRGRIRTELSSERCPLILSRELLRLIEAKNANRERLVVFVNPHARVDTDGGEPLAAAVALAQQARRARISVAAIIEPFESRPAAWLVPPNRFHPGEPERASLDLVVRRIDALTVGSRKPTIDLRGRGARGSHPTLDLQSFQSLASSGWIATPSPSDPLGLQLARTGSPGSSAGTSVEVLSAPPAGFFSKDVEGISTRLVDGNGRFVADSYTPIDRVRPRILYIPTRAFLRDSDVAKFGLREDIPALLASILRDDASSAEYYRHLLWPRRGNREAAGFTVFWPGPAANWPTAVRQRVHEGGFSLSVLPGAVDLKSYECVIIDASVPADLASDGVERPGTGPKPIGYAGGLTPLRRDIGDVAAFQDALKGYVRDGGNVLLIGSNPMCWDESRVDDAGRPLNLVALLRGLLPQPIAAPVMRRVGDTPRRLIFALDETQSSYSESDNPAGTFSTLPPLAESGPTVQLEAIARSLGRVPADVVPLWEEQLAIWLGVKANGQLPKRDTVGGLAAVRSAVAQGRGDRHDREFANLLDSVSLDSKAEFARTVISQAAAPFRHPSLLAELQGDAIFRRHFQRPSSPSHGWALQEPLRMPIRGRSWPNWLLGGYLEPTAATSWLDGIELRSMIEYLTATQSEGVPDPPHIVLGLLDGDDVENLRKPVVRDGRPLDELWAPASTLGDSDDRLLLFLTHQGSESRLRRRTGNSALLPSVASWQQRLVFMGRGRIARLLSTAVAWRLQRIACRSDLARIAQFAGASRCAEMPEALDLLKLDVERRLLLGTRPSFVPTADLLSAAGGEILIATEQGDPIVVGLRPFPAGGRVVLMLLDPDLESRLNSLRYPAGWTDVSPSHSHPPDDPAPGILQLRCRGRRLELRVLTAIDTTPRLAVPAAGMAAPEIVAVRVHSSLGLREVEPTILPRDAYEEEKVAGATILNLKPIPQLNATSTIPSLLEVEARVGVNTASVFLPWTAVGYEPGTSSDSLLASPTNQLIDLVVGLFHRRSFRAAYDIRTHGVVIWPVGDRIHPDLVSVIKAGRPVANWSGDSGPSVLSRLTLPVPPSVSDDVLEVQITSGDGRESAHVFVPEPSDLYQPMYPSETGDSLQHPVDGVLDTLTIATSPRFTPLSGELGSVIRAPTAARGLVVTPMRHDSSEGLIAFVGDTLAMRYRDHSPRHWYLTALVLFTASWLTRAYGRLRG